MSELTSGNHAFFVGGLAALLVQASERMGWTVEAAVDAQGDFRPVLTVTTVSGTKFSVIAAEVPGTNPDPDGLPGTEKGTTA